MEALNGVEIEDALGLRRRSERRVTVTSVSSDSRKVKPGALFVAIPGPNFDGHDFVAAAFAQGAAAALVSQPVELPSEYSARPLFQVGDTVEALGRLASHYRRRWGKTVVGVTGSNGKTTTRAMLAHLLGGRRSVVQSPKSFNNAIGVPHTLFQLERAHEVGVVEMGANAAGEIAALAAIAQPELGVVTNIGEAHLEGFGSIEGVARAKGELVQALGAGGVAFLNADDPWTPRLARRHRGRTVTFGRGEQADVRCVSEERAPRGTRFRLAGGREFHLPVPGAHNVSNALAALAVCRELDALDGAAERMESFASPEMRFQIARIGELTLIADCYNANLRSMLAALDEMDSMPCEGRRVMVCGDMMEMGPEDERMHRELGRRIGASRIDEIHTVGRSARWAAEEANALRKLPSRHYPSAEPAGRSLAESLGPGDLVLVKGSRGLRLEGVVEAVKARFAG